MRVFILTLFTTIFLCAAALHAQIPNTGLRGRVLDPSGAVIPDAEVRILQGSSIAGEAKTDMSGVFAFNLSLGQYRLEIAAAGFKAHQQNIRVVPNMPPLSISMSLAGINSSVDVASKDDTVSLDNDANLTSTSIAGDAVSDLPADDDALMAQLQQLAAGSGAAGSTATFVVDGFSNGRVPPRDQIQQIIIDTNVFSAENTGGGPRIQIITKPGTGPWTGNLTMNFGDEAFNARNPFDANKPSKQQRIFVTSYGGPAIPGKLTLRFSARSVQLDTEAGSVIAITPNGAVNTSIFSPVRNENLSLNGQLFVTQTNTFNFNVNYNTNAQRNQGVGGITLPERALNFKGHNWNFQVSERAIVTSKFISELRFSMFHNQNSLLPITEGYAVNVLDAFNGGGGQNRTHRRGTNYNFGNTFRWTAAPALNLQIGTEFFYTKSYSSSLANYQGLFVFSSLADYIAGKPLTFRKTTGDPVLNIQQLEGAAFVQADWRVNSKLNVGAGARYQAQTNVADYNNIGPTFQIAYQPRTGTVLRAGARMSHQVFPIFNIEQIRRLDGATHQIETVITNPSFPDPFAGGTGVAADSRTASISTLDPNFVMPYVINSALTLEQSLKNGWRFSGSIDVSRGVHLRRTRNINAPYPGTPLPQEVLRRLYSSDPAAQAAARNEIDRMRPLFPRVGNIYALESAANSFSKNAGMRVYLPNNLTFHGWGFNGYAQYTLGWADDDASAVNDYDWNSEWAPSNFDTRHRFVSNVNVRLPQMTTLSVFTFANSGRPYSMTTGRDDNGDQAVTDRPSGVPRNSLTAPATYTVNISVTKQFNLRKAEPGKPATEAANAPGAVPPPQVFAPGPGAPIFIPQGGLGGPPAASPGPKLTFNANVNNLFNNIQVRSYGGVLTSPLFGKPTSAANGRTIMLGLGFSF